MKHSQIVLIYKEFGSEKVITGIKNTNITIKYRNPYLGMIAPFVLMVMAFNLLIPMKIMGFSGIVTNSILGLVMLLALFIFLSQSYTIYFENDRILLKNKLNKEKILDLTKYPRIYMKYEETDTYDSSNEYSYTSKDYHLCLQQNNTNIILNIEFLGSKKLATFLHNLQMKNKEEVTLEQWQSSASNEEETFFHYFDFLAKQERIVGIKYPKLNFKIMNNDNLKLKVLICSLLAIISFGISYLIKNNLDLAKVFVTISVFLIVADLFLITQIAEKWKNLYLKISYPSNSTIKINRQVFDYKENDIMISIETYVDRKSNNKHNYRLLISSNGRILSSINLNLKQEKELGNFINNLIFQEKSLS